jgi:hypothetical protein
MAALRLPIEAADHRALMPAIALIYPHFARAALDFLGSLAKGACHESIEARSTSRWKLRLAVVEDGCDDRRTHITIFGNERTIRG